MNEISAVQIDFLKAYADAWNARDIERIMQAMTSDCAFEAADAVGRTCYELSGYLP